MPTPITAGLALACRQHEQGLARTVGAALGALAGIAAAFLFIRRGEETGEPPSIRKTDPGQVLGTGVTLLGLLRQIADLGQRR